MAYFRL